MFCNAKEAHDLVSMYEPLLTVEGCEPIRDYDTAYATARVIDNTIRMAQSRGAKLVVESDLGGHGVAGAGIPGATSNGGVLDMTGPDAGNNMIPSVIIPMVRRWFPQLLAHELFSVQPMAAPLGYAFAYRMYYGETGSLVPGADGADGNATLSGEYCNTNQREVGYNNLAGWYTGKKTEAFADAAKQAMWEAYAGAGTPAGRYFEGGEGVATADGEWASIGGAMPQIHFGLVKKSVESKTRKLAAHWSLELAEDMKAMHGLDVGDEMASGIGYELAAEIDRQLVNTAVQVAIDGGQFTSWSPVSADGRNLRERLYTLMVELNYNSNLIAEHTRRGNANICIASTRATTLIQSLAPQDFFKANARGGVPTVPDSGIGALLKVGLINGNSQLLIRDTFARGDYAMLMYKGSKAGDSGIIYCPYVPVEMMKAVDFTNFTPVLGARTRYGVLENAQGSANYFRFFSLKDIAGATTLVGDDSGKRFWYSSAKDMGVDGLHV